MVSLQARVICVFSILKQYVLAIFKVGVGEGRLGAHSALTWTVGRFHSSLC